MSPVTTEEQYCARYCFFVPLRSGAFGLLGTRIFTAVNPTLGGLINFSIDLILAIFLKNIPLESRLDPKKEISARLVFWGLSIAAAYGILNVAGYDVTIGKIIKTGIAGIVTAVLVSYVAFGTLTALGARFTEESKKEFFQLIGGF